MEQKELQEYKGTLITDHNAIKRNMNTFLGSIRKRIWFTGLFFIAACLGFIAISIFLLTRIEADYKNLKEKAITGKVAVLEINRDVNYVSRLVRNVMLGSNINKDADKLDKRIQSIENSYQILQSSVISQKELELIQKAEKASLNFVKAGKQHLEKIRPLSVEDRNSSYLTYSTSATPLAVQSRNLFPQIIKLIDQNLDHALQSHENYLNLLINFLYISCAGFLTLLSGLVYLLLKSIVKPIETTVEVVKLVGEGDLEQEVPVSGNTKNELNLLAEAINQTSRNLFKKARLASEIAAGKLTGELEIASEKDTLGLAIREMLANLKTMLTDIQQYATTLSDSSRSLNHISTELVDGFTQMRQECGDANQITDSMTQNIRVVASGASQVLENMKSVDDAVSDMNHSIHGVEEHTREGLEISENARDMSNQVSLSMEALGKAGSEIGKVTSVIKKIAEQTNLLALNATIEAASAGVAGKGFAVVANEIKELANQSAKAAEDIAQKITDVQSGTAQAEQMTLQVSEIIETMSSASSSIAEAVEVQTERIDNISSSMNTTKNELENMVQSLTQVNTDSSVVAERISRVDKGVVASSDKSDLMHGNASQLAELAESLKTITEKFELDKEHHEGEIDIFAD